MQQLNRVRVALLLAAAIASPLAAPALAREVAATAIPAQQRLLPLEGGQNFRELGGYKTADGREVKWGLLYRSGAMNRLTEADFRYLASLGLKTVVDFRDNNERAREAVAWPAASAPQILTHDYSMDHSAIAKPLSQPGLTGEQARAAMASLYREIPLTFADQYRALFAQLLGGDGAVAFNCTAGKDRTGVAAAILLSVLGVPRETVIEDYLLSNQYFRPRKEMLADDRQSQMYSKLSPDVIKALMGVDRSYLEAAFATIDSQPGGVEGYYRDKLGLDAAKIALLRAKYLSPRPEGA
ncbi:tyrosine-protein phosphatase [Sandaracinobacter sp. RS1-74]|uniref:tyrosine-protein phosphatase n=1 Tax=Sandaracinobacteroides sayramensis TaxID=2913411 RepID=UPI001EDC14A8|nr:tyrosine-protein phosphatase [Sandaracinobacteroides sayramensis]MCG2840895.1 tyrosine-protein phosphatase [Sandaracinobacteroides sayramensis]